MIDRQPELGHSENDKRGESIDSISFKRYQNFADVVGMVPSLRWKDNLIQAVVVLLFVGIGALAGWLIWGPPGALGLAFAGLVIGGLLSGLVLMVLGWVRTSTRP